MDSCLKRNVVLGILAHVDAGKTTLAEQILYHTGAIRQRGRVDHKDAFLDSHAIEKERGITIFSQQADFNIGSNMYTLLDTPGHVDFSSEMERALKIMDYAVVIVSAAEGIQGHTETVWQLLRSYGVPTFIFLNKTDRVSADTKQLIAALQLRFSQKVCDFSQSADQLAEELAQMDEALMEEFCGEQINSGLWKERLQQMVATEQLFPLFSGSALQDVGVDRFLEGVDALVLHRTENSEKPFSGEVYKIRYDSRGERIAYLKILEGRLRAKDTVRCLEGTARKEKKVNRLFTCQAEKQIALQEAGAGRVCAVTGLDCVRPGDLIGAKLGHSGYNLVPLLQTKVLFPKETLVASVLPKFRQLVDEDPMLEVEWNEPLQELQIHVMGTVQLEILKELVWERFALEISFGPCEVLYQETIAAPVIGYGHFEPLRHYAEVHLRLEPAPRGSGISFASECPLEVLDKPFQHLVEQHIYEKTHKGVLLGMALTDIKITLINGRAHLKHTEGGDFREATYRAVRQGLEQAQSVILEPVYAFSIEVDQEQTGKVMSDLEKRHCTFQAPETMGERIKVIGNGPASALMDYPADFASFTRGRGMLQLRFDGYQRCHNPEEVIQRSGYDKIRDTENTSDSVFCKKGAGFPVKWDQVKNYIHCKT